MRRGGQVLRDAQARVVILARLSRPLYLSLDVVTPYFGCSCIVDVVQQLSSCRVGRLASSTAKAALSPSPRRLSALK